MIGEKYGVLTVVSEAISKGKNGRWLCQCDCGALREYSTHYIKTNNINRCRQCGRVRYVCHGGYYEGTLSNGATFTFDAEDYDVVSKYQWNSDAKGYIWCRYGYNRKPVRIHRLVLNAAEGYEVDHIDGNRLNNRKYNLRVCTTAQNCANRSVRSDNTSGVPGVKYDSGKGKWAAGIGHNRRYIHLGYFSDLDEAIGVRKDAETRYHGEFAYK